MSEFSVGQKVVAISDIWSEADEHSPLMLLARAGESLVVRKVGNDPWAAGVSHEHITDNSFGVRACEICVDSAAKGGAE